MNTFFSIPSALHLSARSAFVRNSLSTKNVLYYNERYKRKMRTWETVRNHILLPTPMNEVADANKHIVGYQFALFSN